MQALVERESGAWTTLLEALHPELEQIVKNQPLGRLRDDVDVHRDIVTKTIDKLHKDEHRAIARFVDHEAPPPVEAWMRVMVRNAAIDVMRARPEFIRGRGGDKAKWLSLATLATRDGVRQADSLAAKRREVESFLANAIAAARALVIELGNAEAATKLADEWKIQVLHTRRLTKKAELYQPVLSLVLAGHDHTEIAERLDLSRREVELVIGYLEQFFHASGFAAD